MRKVKRFFLEIKNLDNKKKIFKIKNNIKFLLEKKNKFDLNKFFYKQIGSDHFWRDRLAWSDKDWLKYVSNPNLETWIMLKNNDLVGFYEKEFHPSKNEVELINLGILKEYRGKKLGSLLVKHVVQNSLNDNQERIWVHTCSLDHKFALDNYLSRGFQVFKEEEINYVA
tara:strand:+ start:217 stop:723 length:507 start_codon:yes stop_codon:yes gene_type:complete